MLFFLFTVAVASYPYFRYSKANKRDFANSYDIMSGARRAFKTGGRYHMTMELRKSDLEGWLDVDEKYAAFHNIRSQLLDDKKCRVLQCLPGSEAACVEVLDLVVESLTQRFPEKFKAHFSFFKIQFVEVVATCEIFEVTAPFNGLEPLEIAARLAMEDLNILVKGEDNIHTL